MTREILSPEEWSKRRAVHEARTAPWIEPHLARSFTGERHPVYDFLFSYYSYRPGHLKRWHPGTGIALAGDDAREFLAYAGYKSNPEGVAVSTDTLKPERHVFIRWLLKMLESVRDRPPFFGCSGLHEWAMVYQTSEVRHPVLPLRLGPSEIDHIVEQLPVRCSHYDAFRFFTSAAQPLNRLQPDRQTAADFDQPGCLHANMDLYKWAYKLAPFTSSELVADTFELARDIREIDMRASPNDLWALGFPPIPIETPAGRDEYESAQRAFTARSAPLRDRLIGVCRTLLGCGAA